MKNALKYQNIKNQTITVLALTGYKSDEFESLLETFTQVYEEKYTHLTLAGKVRERKSFVKERFNGQLPLCEDKLLFILYQMKLNPLQESMAVTFGMKQPHVSKWLKLLRPLLQETLKREQSLPERNPKRLWIKVQEKDIVIIDGVERPIQRNKDNDIQNEDYSGKKTTYNKKYRNL